jgi:SNF2 family DNA or RNA helicase
MRNVDIHFKTKPYAHQLEAWSRSKDESNYGLIMDMGTGKSKVIVDTLAYLWNMERITGALIIAPKGAYRNWTKDDTGEIDTHMPDKVPYFCTYWSPVATKALRKEHDYLMRVNGDLHILVMNVEALSTERGYDFAKAFITRRPSLMAVDESTTIKNSQNARRAKNAIKLGQFARYRRILTGQPVTRSPLDLFGQCQFLSWRLLGFSSYYSFRARYAILVNKKFGMRSFVAVDGYQRLDELKDKLATFSYRVTKAECLDLPPKVYVKRFLEMTPDQRKMYNTIVKEALIFLDDKKVSINGVMSRLEKLHQVTCGHLKTDDKGVIQFKHNKIDELMQLLEETDGKVIIWATYRHDIATICSVIAKEYGDESVGHMYGDTSDEQREEFKARFQDPKDSLRFLVCNPATGRFGTTLTQGATVIYYSYTWDLEHRNQSEDRTHRIGSEIHEKITYVTFITPGTIEEQIYDSLESKQKLSDAIMGDINRGTWRNWFKEVQDE